MTDDAEVVAVPAEADPDPHALGELGEAAERLRVVLQAETELARSGGLGEFATAIRDKKAALAAFTEIMARMEFGSLRGSLADRSAVRRLMATADENALVLDAVRSTIDDLAGRLRKALTAMADPGTYGPSGPRPRFAMAARVDTKF